MFRRKEEERIDIKTLRKAIIGEQDSKKEEIMEKLDTISQQVGLLSRYLSHVSRKVDDSLTLIKVQEEKIKDLESRIEALTARELD